ncbi:DUF2975 domain-containing protein [Nocardiopsis sp. CC223A]|uniref:DUF2975 domain-containing protein n=1 Tax=Nocardiopsis sp. CC223A TaxID=3044051 RepID=UPI0027960372|nr:DUF2975 domain-containing protein [Nocardiopsis sp. CC223A]
MPKTTPFRWSRADSLALRLLLGGFLALQAVHAVVLLLWIPGGLPAGTLGLNVLRHWLPADTDPLPAPVAVTGGVTAHTGEDMVLVFHDPTAAERLLLAVPGLLGVAAMLLVAFLLLRMAGTLSAGDPFVPANVRRLYAIALTVIIGALSVPFVEAFTGMLLQDGVVESRAPVLFAFEVTFGGTTGALLLAGFLLAGLAEVFRRGAQMRNDVRGLV